MLTEIDNSHRLNPERSTSIFTGDIIDIKAKIDNVINTFYLNYNNEEINIALSAINGTVYLDIRNTII